MKNILTYLLLITTLSVFGQTEFDEGYYIDNQGNYINGKIKNKGWKNNPTKFNFQIDNHSETINIKDAKEFGIKNKLTYIRATVDIDRSSESLNALSTTKNPIFKQELLYLKVLVKGKAKLLSYEDKNLVRYFYQVDTSGIVPLTYKMYLMDYEQIGKNYQFRNQLWLNMRYSENISSVENLKYNHKSLSKYVNNYNTIKDPNYIASEDSTKKKTKVQFNLKAGVDISNLSISNDQSIYGNGDFEEQQSLRIGAELELFLPFNNNKWAAFIEPSYRSFNSTATTHMREYYAEHYKIEYQSIELPIGLRHYFYLSKKSKIFLNTALTFDFTINTKIQQSSNVQAATKDLDTNSYVNALLGAGYKYGNRWTIEARYYTPRNLLRSYIKRNAQFQSFSFILGYTLF